MSELAGATRSPSRSLAYPVVLALSALDAAGYSVISPVLPEIASRTGSGPATIGALSAAFPVGILLGFPVAGRWIKRRDCESLLVVSALVVAVGAVPFVLRTHLTAFILGRLVMGLGSGGLWMALLGPVFGALGGVRAPFAAYILIALVGAGAVPLMGRPAERRPFTTDRSLLRAPGFALASVGISFAVLGLGVVDGVLPLHLGTRLSQQGIAALFVGVAVIHAMGATLAGRVAPRMALAISTAIVVAGIGVTGAVEAPIVWFAALAIGGVGVGFGETASVGVLLDAVPAERSVTAMVVWSQIGIVGYIVGPLAGGVVAQTLGFAWMGLVPFLGAVPVMVLMRRTRTSAE